MTGEVLERKQEAHSRARLRLWLRLLKVSRKIEGQLRERLRTDFATTLPRFDVMAALNRHAEGLKMSQLSGVLRVSNGNVTGIVDRLVEEGLVVRVPVKGDRRAFLVQLTERGKAHFARQAEAHAGWIDELLGDFPAEEADGLAHRFDALAQLLDGLETRR
ncbi:MULTISPECIES: MarR family transcriptional regulator [unclassified Roseitalea]|uniref:MarR family winged helix-turn-helix transcriptional regulator n=1 Tax=unclassified Roseitalea TaxID=2639107 RepID=UPI00273F82EF|nr:MULTISPECIES: MarR family transcriptional regulator [unclassified Roseitalea]